MRKLKKYKPTAFIADGSYYDEDAADYAVAFIEALSGQAHDDRALVFSR